ncbi:DUF2442 domain-containing protein [Paludibacterium sp.]|uniref:DUF2442 domain-containing protein n=1 Tax=Paludibacterium sp. TaxID=1917523 RepID=UPI0025EFC8E9|nr:DUF2442 domain-containing protein [Paludibacterium sp.]MBV8648165.1 DUF2442 domain-containing protein [Paludibacterium sp.]
MTVVKAKEPLDEPVTADVLAQAITRGHDRQSTSSHATSIRYLPAPRALLIGFANASPVMLPVANYPELATLDQAALERLQLGFGGSALCLEEQDVHISIAGQISGNQQ